MPSRRTSAPPKVAAAAPSPGELRDLLAHLLAGVAGGTEVKWRKLVGDVQHLPIVFNPRSNWRIDPTGTPTERDAIEKAVEVVREAHPYVSAQTAA